jgi:hypothetical protein
VGKATLTVNNRHEGIKTFLRPRRGIATRYLPNNLRWFDLVTMHQALTAHACLDTALGSPPRSGVPTGRKLSQSKIKR